MDIAYVSAEFQVIVDFGLHVGASRDALVLRVDYHTVVAQETDRSIVLCLLRTAGSRDAVVLLPGCTGHHVLPVNLLAFAVILLAPHFVPKACAVVGTCLAQVGGILVYITNVQLVGQCLETEVGSDVDGRMSFCPVFSSNHDYTVGTCRTIDGSCGGILQHFDGFDVGRIDEVGIGTHLYAVYYIERVCLAVDGGNTTDTDGGIGIGSTVLHGYYDTRGCTLQALCNVGRSAAQHVFCVYRSYRTGNVALLHRTVAHNYYFVQSLCVFFQYDVQCGLAGYLDSLSDIADKGEGQFGIGGNAHLILTVDVCDDAVSRTYLQDVYTRHAFAAGIFYGTFHCNVLGTYPNRNHQ